jgi:hypothetical protein
MHQPETTVAVSSHSEAVPPTRQHTAESSRRLFVWPDSLWFNLAIATVIGFLYTLSLMGPRPINPRNVGWLTPDAATYHIGWEMFRQDPHIHWPLMFTERLGYPNGESVALMDPNSLLALLLKPFSVLLPEPFQYLGIEVVLMCGLQFFFALRLFRLLVGANPFAVVLPATFFLMAPPLSYRLVGHYALSNHWLLLATFLAMALAQRQWSICRSVIWFLILAGISLAVNPYIAFQVVLLLTASIASLLWQRRLTWVGAGGMMIALGATCYLVASTLGLFISGGRGYSAGGYRYYSLNLLSVLDPGRAGSLFRQVPLFTTGQYEGYNYLGAGIIFLAIILLPTLLIQWRRFRRLNVQVLLPLVTCFFILTLLALSTKISFGSSAWIDLDPHEKLTSFLAPFRATGRLFWAPYYTLLASILAATFVSFPQRWAIVLISLALAVQVADTNPLRRWVYSQVNQTHRLPLRSPVWSTLGSLHENLVVLPAWQCGSESSPGGADGYRIFGFLAAAQRMRINSYYSARYTETSRDYECGKAISVLTGQPLSPDSAYVVTPVVARLIAEGPTGPGKCHNVDRFILCSSRTDFGLSSDLNNPADQLRNAIENPGFEDGNLSSWDSFQDVRADVTTAQAHSGSHSLAETTGVGSLYQDVTELEAGKTYTVSAWVSAIPDATATAQIAIWDPGRQVATFSGAVTPHPGWQLLMHTVTASAAGSIRIHLFRNKGVGTIFWDDVRIYRQE